MVRAMRSLPDILYNFHWIVPGKAARAAQAYARLLGPFLSARGIKAVVNLRGNNPDWGWWRYETRICAERGIAHADVRLSSKHLPTRAMLTALIAAFDTVPLPLLVKCSGGQDRTSLAAALFILHTQGWEALPAALAQYARWPYLHLPKPHQRWLRLFIDYAQERAHGAPVGRWIAADYSGEDFAAWLDARGERGSYQLIALSV